MKYLNFFFGNRVRGITTIVLSLSTFSVAYFRPDLITKAVSQALNSIITGVFIAIEPVMEPLLVLIVMGIGFSIMLKGFKGSSKKN